MRHILSKISNCPHCGSRQIKKDGRFQRKRNHQKVQRYKCKVCFKSFSDQLFHPTYRQKRPDLNRQILEHLSTSSGIRNLKFLLRTTRKTIQRKILFLSGVCEEFHKIYMGKWDRAPKPRFQFDEFESIENNRVRTLTIPAVVEVNSHFLVDVKAVRTTSRCQYPYQKDEYESEFASQIAQRHTHIRNTLKSCRKMKPEGRIVVESDMKKTYPSYMKQAFGKYGVHLEYDASLEKNKKKLFTVNSVIACMRANVSMVRRKSWHICKNIDRLNARLTIYKFFFNYLKEKRLTMPDKSKKILTPAMHLGILDRPVNLEFIYNTII